MIDETDLGIIERLKQDGRASYKDIADEMGLATSTVAGRVKKLQDNDVITGFRPVINYEEIGFGLTAMIAIKAEADMIPKTADSLQENKRVLSFFEVTGSTDMVVISRFIDREDMNSFLKKFQTTEGVKSTETNVILTKPKLEDGMDLKEIFKRLDDSPFDL